MRRLAGSALILLALGYLAWPYWAAWALYAAINDRDTATLEHAVDWPAFRSNLKASLLRRLERDGGRMVVEVPAGGRLGQLSFEVTPATIEAFLKEWATPQALPLLFASESLTRGPAQSRGPSASKAAPPAPAAGSRRRVAWAFFASPTRFEVEIVPPGRPTERIVPILAFGGSAWRLVDLQFR